MRFRPFRRLGLRARLTITFALGAAVLSIVMSIVTWGLLSPTDGAIYAITAGYIDNAFDIQRRRGEDPSAKTTFTV